ncbi:MAG TPA: hypothetical protein VG322_13025 [Candidatus Acidoferrales bacterium]|jgi:hypothetical protein|nr:hypothetical protein [Candidatus Acidoferrales bacterium]
MKKRDNEESAAQSAIVLAGVVIVVAVLAVLFGLQTLVWINAKHWASLDSWLNDTPQPLSSSANALPPTPAPLDKKGKAIKPVQLRAYDYEFSPPWPGNSKLVPGDTFVQFRFGSGQVIAFLDPGAQIDVVRQMKTGETTQYNQFSNVFGDQLPNTNYDLYNIVYSASPAKISPFMHSQDAFRDNVLLLWKLSFGFDMQPGIHSIAGGMNRGFEFGDPASGKPVALRLFDQADKQARFIFTVAAGSAGAITQDDIDKIVQSFKLIPVMER